MPVVGLSRPEDVDPRFVEIGRLRKGAPKSGNQPGKDLPHFRYVPNVRYQESAAVFEEIYGKEPTELEVYFPLDSMLRVFSSWREQYGQNRMCRLRCDGARWHDWIDGDRHFHSEAGRECELPYRDTENKCPECPCQYSGKLSVYLKPMWKAGQIGLVTVLTSSINDIAHLAAKLVQWEPLTGKPFTLWRAPERIGVPIQGERRARDSNLLHLELADEWMRGAYALAEQQATAQLVAPIRRTGEPSNPYEDSGDYEMDDRLPFDDELLEGDEFLSRSGDYSGAKPDEGTHEVLKEEAEAAPPTSPEPLPNGLTHRNIVKLAVKHLDGYRTQGQVKQAILDILQDSRWESHTEWSKSEVWYGLQEHLKAPAPA